MTVGGIPSPHAQLLRFACTNPGLACTLGLAAIEHRARRLVAQCSVFFSQPNHHKQNTIILISESKHQIGSGPPKNSFRTKLLLAPVHDCHLACCNITACATAAKPCLYWVPSKTGYCCHGLEPGQLEQNSILAVAECPDVIAQGTPFS